MKVHIYWCFSYVCNKLPQNLAAWQQTLCHTAAEVKEIGSSLAGWFCLSRGCSKLLSRLAVTSKIYWGWSICFPTHSHGCWHTLVPHWLLARGISSSPVGLFVGLLTAWQFASPRAKGGTERGWRERQGETETEKETEREFKRQTTAFYNLISKVTHLMWRLKILELKKKKKKVTYHHFYHMPLVTEVNLVQCGRRLCKGGIAGIPGAILEAGYHNWHKFLFYFIFFNLFIFIYFYGCVGSSFLCEDFL